MPLKTEYSRLITKHTDIIGITPSVPVDDDDFDNFLATDIFNGELFINLPDQTIWSRNGSQVFQLSGGLNGATGPAGVSIVDGEVVNNTLIFETSTGSTFSVAGEIIGKDGALSFRETYAGTINPPSAGEFATDVTTGASVSTIRIANVDRGGVDYNSWIGYVRGRLMTDGADVYIQITNLQDNSNVLVYQAGEMFNTAFDTHNLLNVVYVAGNGDFITDEDYSLSFWIEGIGNIGATGATGADGATGATGPAGLDGPIGPTGATGAQGTSIVAGQVSGETLILEDNLGVTFSIGGSILGPTGATGADSTVPGPTGATGGDIIAGFVVGDTLVLENTISGTFAVSGSILGATGATGPQGATGATGTFQGDVIMFQTGEVLSASFSGSPLIYDVSFIGTFTASYVVNIDSIDPRDFTISNKSGSGFRINTNSSTALTQPVEWMAIETSNNVIGAFVGAQGPEFIPSSSTGTVIAFTSSLIYNSPSSPATGNITDDLTGAKIGIIQKIYHNDSTTPSFPAGWVRLGQGAYLTSNLNIIYAEWVSGTRVEYWITN